MAEATAEGTRMLVLVEMPPGVTDVVVIRGSGSSATVVGPLVDSGVTPDVVAGDGIYTGSVDVPAGTPLVVRYTYAGQSHTSSTLVYESPSSGNYLDRCVFVYGEVTTCRSGNPNVETLFTHLDDTTRCSFALSIDWGDGTVTQHTISGGPAGKVRLGEHTYRAPGTYTITSTGKVVSGACYLRHPSYTFTLHGANSVVACARNFDYHTGRTYMYAMKPVGRLTYSDGRPVTTFDYELTGDNQYVDEAGVPWVLMSAFGSSYHQPAWWHDGNPFYDWLNGAPFKKFVAVDSRGGSFEAVLMPNGMTPDSPKPPADTTYQYSTNWLTEGPGMPTYNYVDASTSYWGHYQRDMRPHGERGGDSAYVAPTRWIDPQTSDWKTYAQRLDDVFRHIQEQGFRYTDNGGQPRLVNGARSVAVAPDLAWLAKEISDCQATAQ